MKNRVKSVFDEVINSLETSTKFISNFNVFNNVKITSYNSAYMRTPGEKVCISDEAERVQSVSYSHIRSFSGLYTVAQGKASEALASGPSFQGPHSWHFARKYSSFLVKKIIIRSYNIFLTTPYLKYSAFNGTPRATTTVMCK